MSLAGVRVLQTGTALWYREKGEGGASRNTLLFVWVRAFPDDQFGARGCLFVFSKRGDEFASAVAKQDAEKPVWIVIPRGADLIGTTTRRPPAGRSPSAGVGPKALGRRAVLASTALIVRSPQSSRESRRRPIARGWSSFRG